MQKAKSCLLGCRIKIAVGEIINRSIKLSITLLIPAVQLKRLKFTLNAELLRKLNTLQLIVYLWFFFLVCVCTVHEYNTSYMTEIVLFWLSLSKV